MVISYIKFDIFVFSYSHDICIFTISIYVRHYFKSKFFPDRLFFDSCWNDISRDNVTVRVNAVLYFQVADSRKAIIQVEGYEVATGLLV